MSNSHGHQGSVFVPLSCVITREMEVNVALDVKPVVCANAKVTINLVVEIKMMQPLQDDADPEKFHCPRISLASSIF
jgi:hypothetical protein